MDTSYEHNSLQFCTVHYETLHVFSSWYVDMHVVWIQLLDNFFSHFFHIVNLVIFHPQYINSGYLMITTPHTILYLSFWNFAHVFFIVWRSACAFDIVLALSFVIFFFFVNVIIFWLQMYRQGLLCDFSSSYNFIPVVLKLCTFFLPGLQKCMRLGYNFQIHFCHFFHFNFVIFFTSCGCNSSYSCGWNCLKLCRYFCYSL